MNLREAFPKSTRVERTPVVRLPGESRFHWILGGVLALHLFLLNLWQTIRFNHFAGTKDESTVFQALYLISHGTLNPFSTTTGFPWIQNHGAAIMWLLAPIDRLGTPGISILYLQGIGAVATEFVAIYWILQLLRDRVPSQLSPRRAYWILATALFVSVVQPWSYWSVGWDFHIEIPVAPFILAAAMDFSRARYRRGLIWVVICLGFGDVASTFLIGLALSAVLAAVGNRDQRRTLVGLAGALVAMGAGWSGLISIVGFAKGSTFARNFGFLTVPLTQKAPKHAGYTKIVLAGLEHPIRFAHVVAYHWRNLYANTAPFGVVGIATTWTLGVPLVILVENNLTKGFNFNQPEFQSFPVYGFILVGTVMLIVSLSARYTGRKLLGGLLLALGLNATLWGAIFLPHLAETLMPVTPAQASTLNAILREIPPDAPVAVSPGVSGRFASRRYVYLLRGHPKIPLETVPLWIVIAPTAGVEAPPARADALIRKLATSPDARLITNQNGIYAFEWMPRTPTPFALRHIPPGIPSWTAVGGGGTAIEEGPARSWYVTSNGTPAYVVAQDYYKVGAGTFNVDVRLNNAGPLNLEVWNVVNNTLLVRQNLSADTTTRTIHFPLTLPTRARGKSAFSGWGPFVDQPPKPKPHNILEIRLYNESGQAVNVYSLSLTEQLPAP
jgi:hypothetical protein